METSQIGGTPSRADLPDDAAAATMPPVATLSTTVVGRVVWGLVGLAVVLGLARIVGLEVVGTDTPLGELRPFDVDDEASIPTWVATVLLLLAGGAWGLTAWLRRGAPVARVAGGVAIALVLASLDEGSSLHETIIEPLRDGLGLEGPLRFAWVLVGAPVLLALVVAVVRVRDRLPRPVAFRLLVGVATFGAGAVGMELLGGAVYDAYGPDSIQWALSTLVEESLELVGTGIVAGAGLELLRRSVDGFGIDVTA